MSVGVRGALDHVAARPGPRYRALGWRLAPVALLLATAVLYLWNLDVSGFANPFYAAAVQAGAVDPTAFFFGSLDPSNAITVDKPPASLWPMVIAARIAGFSSWSLLVPQALMGVGAVGLLHAAVRRVSGPGAGLLAGGLLALTPVAALMFRFDNPDALLTLMLVAAGYLVVRGLADGRTRWVAAAGLVVGLAFLTKSLQAFLVLPGLAAAWACAAPGSPWRRVRQLVAGGAGIVVGAGWWLLAVAVWPVGARPYIGGSGDNTPLGLALGYNGLGRILGEDLPEPHGFPAGPAVPDGLLALVGGPPGPGRLFSSLFATQASWLLPASVVLLVAGLVSRRGTPRTDPVRASLLAWGGWTVVTAAVLSVMSGIVHPYYTVAMAPGIAAALAIGGRETLRRRSARPVRALLAVTTIGTAAWAVLLLVRDGAVAGWLPWAVGALGIAGGTAWLVGAGSRRWLATALGVALVAGVTGPAAYTLQTVSVAHHGGLPTAGPVRPSDLALPEPPPVDDRLVTDLRAASRTHRWAAATVGSPLASSLMLAAGPGSSVMAVGGFLGTDPAPTAARFQAAVRRGEIGYFVEAPHPFGLPGADADAITGWVHAHVTGRPIGTLVVYDLSATSRDAAAAPAG